MLLGFEKRPELGSFSAGLGWIAAAGLLGRGRRKAKGRAESAEKNSFLKRDFETYFKYLKHAFNSNLKTLFEIGFEYIMSLFVKYILNQF